MWNRTREKAAALVARGAILHETPAEAARGVDRLHLCLSDDAAVDSVLEQVLPTLTQGTPIVDHTTVSPEGAQARARRLAAAGVGFLACPVFMGPPNARQATGRMLCAGPSALIEALAPELKKMTGELVVLGEEVSRPCVLKLIGNAMIIGMAGCVADALAIGVAGGISPEDTQAFLAAMPLAGIIAGRGARMAQGDHRPGFELSMARKDLRLMMEATAGRPLAVLPGLAVRMDSLLEQGLGASDLGVLASGAVPPRG